MSAEQPQMNKLFYTYSVAKALYERGQDYIDVFWPFALRVLSESGTPLSLVSIQEKLRESFNLDIPEHSLKSILSRAKNRGYVVGDGKGQFTRVEKGRRYVDKLESEREVERRINELLEDIKVYLNKELQSSLTLNDVQDIVLSFINQNIESIVEYFNPAGDASQLKIPIQRRRRYEGELVRYLEITEKQKPALYKTLQDIICGSVIYTSSSSSDIAEINKKFGDMEVFLDTNFLVSILELDFPEFNKPAKELFHLLRLNRFKIKIFDFTLGEFVNLLQTYPKKQYLYNIVTEYVRSMSTNLKWCGWTGEDVKEFISKIENKLWDLGIDIEPTYMELKTYKPRKEEHLSAILKHKPMQGKLSRNHDLAAIEKIKEIRGSPKRHIEKAKAFFLTSDRILSRVNFLEMGHKEKATICEVIPDHLLTNILWLKNPTVGKDIPMKSVIAIHSRNMFIDKRVWERFIENLKRLKEEGNISDKDIAMLFYNHYIEKALLEYDESDVDKIAPELIFELVKDAVKKIDAEAQQKLEEQRKSLEAAFEKKEKGLGKRWEAKLLGVKKKLETASKREAKLWVNVISYTFIGLVTFAVFGIVKINFEIIQPIYLALAIVIPLASAYFGVKFKLRRMKARFESKLFNKIYKKKLSQLEF